MTEVIRLELPNLENRDRAVLKTAMLEWLVVAEPQVEQIETGNATANKHMIEVDDALGYLASGPQLHTCELGVAAALGS